jgi:biopolymer transport protein ExbB
MSMRKALSTLSLALLGSAMLPGVAHAWWHSDWQHRTKVTLNTSAAGVETKEALSGVTVPVRLHSGNFDFLSAKPDGSDLRFVAGDDKTPLKYVIEHFDGANELALVWVQVPAVVPGSDKNVLYVYAGNDKATAEAPAGAAVWDSATVAAFHFGDKDGLSVDHTGSLKAALAVSAEPNGLLAASAKLSGAAINWPASDKAKSPASGPYSVSLWVKPTTSQGSLFKQGALSVQLDGGKLQVKLGALSVLGGNVAAGSWSHIGVTLGAGKLTAYVNGEQIGQTDLGAGTAIEGAMQAGEGYTGLMDELQVATTVRSADWMKFNTAAQNGDAKLLASVTETEGSSADEGGEPGYMGILIKSLTPDAKAVIAILAVMFFIAAWVMVTKTVMVGKADKDNRQFLDRFRDANDNLLQLDKGAFHPHSSLFRLYQAGVRELAKRQVGEAGSAPLSGASIDAVKAAIDADLVRENTQLNNRMVLLTIAISGGPFLGLLGTVVGVMITFAAIAAAGDVNVNAIAPGIAAALLATVAGLAVAIPALFGYNYLASRIKAISSEMQIFVDEFVTRVAERYGAR